MPKFKIGQVVKVVGESKCGNNQFLGEEVVLGGVGAKFLGEERSYYVESPDGLRTHYEEPSLKKVKESRKELKAYIADLEDRVESLVQETQDLYFDNAKKYDRIWKLENTILGLEMTLIAKNNTINGLEGLLNDKI